MSLLLFDDQFSLFARNPQIYFLSFADLHTAPTPALITIRKSSVRQSFGLSVLAAGLFGHWQINFLLPLTENTEQSSAHIGRIKKDLGHLLTTQGLKYDSGIRIISRERTRKEQIGFSGI